MVEGVSPDKDTVCVICPLDVEIVPYEVVNPYATDDEAFSSVVQLITAVDVLMTFDPGVMIGPAKSVETVNALAVDVEVFPNASVTLT